MLVVGMMFGVTGALQYLIPGFLKQHLSFEKIRPLHVSSIVFWIIVGAMGVVFSYLQQHTGRKIYSLLLLKIQWILFVVTFLAVVVTYCMGVFGGREYWEFHPILAIPIIAGWTLFLVNFSKSVGSLRNQPVYIWMWLTGIIFFLFTFLESYLWIFPYFRNNVVNDMSVQWKSYGSMVGSWNMLIYGSSIFLMGKISGNNRYGYAPISFALYVLGLLNLMFNWGHHIYTVPTHNYIKLISYVVSMTELLIFGRIILQWQSTLSTARKYVHSTAYRFLIAADAWVFLTLLLAIAISVPTINVYTHGTHITVAHTMGATIGINTFLLLAFAVDILKDKSPVSLNTKWFNRGYWVANISLFIFWISLIAAGIAKAKWQMSDSRIVFGAMMMQLTPYFIVFFISGISLMFGLLLIVFSLLKTQIRNPLKNTVKSYKAEEKELDMIVSS